MSGARVVLDCRWLSIGGAGRVTELLLRGLSQRPAPPDWLLWGPPSLTMWAWPGAEIALTSRDPRAWFGQREAFRIPDGDLVVFMHQQRPLRRRSSLTVVLDTIPLRHGSTPLVRLAKAAYLRRVVAASRGVVTISAYSRECIRRDLGVAPERISIVPMPSDAQLAGRVSALRATTPVADIALYVGNFLPHKNVGRLIEAFSRTRFRREGGRLVLVGGSTGKDDDAAPRLDPAQRPYVEIRTSCDQEELHRMYAQALFLVQPSLEEGFGLPAWEALCCGIPVAASDAGALPEVVGSHADRFNPTSVAEMADALDRCAARARGISRSDATKAAEEFVRRAPTVADLARAFEDLVAASLGTGAAPRWRS